MAVTTGKNNTMGMLGTLASVAGMATGQSWLIALGTGMQGMNAMMNGNSSMQTGQATSGALNEVLNGLKDVWKNPAKTIAQNVKDKVQEMTDTELAKKWTPTYGSNWMNGLGYGLQPDGSYIFI